MSFRYLDMFRPNTEAEAAMAVISTLQAAGWSVALSGDGLLTSGTGMVMTGTHSGYRGLDNPLAWVRVDSPDGVRSFCLHKSDVTVGYAARWNWRVRYCWVADYSPSYSPTAPPAAPYGRTLVGGGTDAVPTFSPWLMARTYMLGAADDAAPYGCWFNGLLTTSATIEVGGLLLDPLEDAAAADRDPYAVGAGAYLFSGLAAAATAPYGHLKTTEILSGATGAGWVRFPALRYAVDAGTLDGNLPSVGGYSAQLPVMYQRHAGMAAPTGYKGRSTLLRWVGEADTTTVCATEQRALDRFCIGQISAPYGGVIIGRP